MSKLFAVVFFFFSSVSAFAGAGPMDDVGDARFRNTYIASTPTGENFASQEYVSQGVSDEGGLLPMPDIYLDRNGRGYVVACPFDASLAESPNTAVPCFQRAWQALGVLDEAIAGGRSYYELKGLQLDVSYRLDLLEKMSQPVKGRFLGELTALREELAELGEQVVKPPVGLTSN